MREPRLGDDIDDFCVRCKRIMNHAVVSVVNAEPAKVRCRTCHSDHDYRHEQAPPPKVDLRKQALFSEVLKKVSPEDAAKVTDGAEPPDVGEDADLAGIDEAEEVETAEVAEEPPEAPAPKPKVKATKKGRK